MKIMKKMTALLLALLMVMGMLVTTSMANPVPSYIKINNTSPNHVYAAYQIFKGDQEADSTILTNIDWGTGINGDNFLTALKNSAYFTGAGGNNVFAAHDDAKGVADVVKGWAPNGAEIKNFADIAGLYLTDTFKESGGQTGNSHYIIDDLADGFYLVKDQQVVNGEDVHTDYILLMVKDSGVTITPKSQLPTLIHTVSSHSNTANGDATDVEVGAPVYHKLEGSLNSYYNDYHQYNVYFVVDIPTGLTLTNVENITAKIAHQNDALPAIDIPDANIRKENNQLIIVLGDLKQQFSGSNGTNALNMNDTIEVNFVTSINPNAITGEGNNPDALANEVTATMYFSNDATQVSGNTPVRYGSVSDKASVYTYQLEITKRDIADDHELQGAVFNLYRKVEAGGGNSESHYIIADMTVVNEGNNSSYNEYKVTGWTQNVASATDLVSGENGKFTVKGLDSMTYRLKEKEAPANYNKLEDDEIVTITATFKDRELNVFNGVVESSDADVDEKTGVIAGSIHNTKGNTLPSTGGIGTTIFYIVGGVLVLGAGAAFVMKRRNEET